MPLNQQIADDLNRSRKPARVIIIYYSRRKPQRSRSRSACMTLHHPITSLVDKAWEMAILIPGPLVTIHLTNSTIRSAIALKAIHPVNVIGLIIWLIVQAQLFRAHPDLDRRVQPLDLERFVLGWQRGVRLTLAIVFVVEDLGVVSDCEGAAGPTRGGP